MKSHATPLQLLMCLIVLTAGAPARASDLAEAVSPGAPERVAVVHGPCPTFSWSQVPGAVQYQLIGYELPEGTEPRDLDLSRAEPILLESVSGGATSWTPELSMCLAPGLAHVWFVRAVFEVDQNEVIDAGPWSSPRFFAVSRAPTVEEVEQALQVLGRYMESRGDTAALLHPMAEGRDRPSDSGRPASQSRADALGDQKAVYSASAAIRGRLTAATGETYGVVGISDSPDGAGVGAANMAGGADLVLDGDVNGDTDARITEAGLDRPSAASETFNFQNSGSGTMTLQVDGVEVVTTATDKDTPPREPGNNLGLAGNYLYVVGGSGSGLDADLLDGEDGSFYLDASNINKGTLSDSHLPPNVALVDQTNVFTVDQKLSEAAPTLYFEDTTAGAYDYWAQVNTNTFYLFLDTNDDGSWETPHPMKFSGRDAVFGGNVSVTGALNASGIGVTHSGYFEGAPVAVTAGTDVGPTSGGYLFVGSTSGANLAIDNNEIQAKSTPSTTATLYLNNEGGDVRIGDSGQTTHIRGDLDIIGDLQIGGINGSDVPHDCSWAVYNTADDAIIEVSCPAGKYAIAGSCYSTTTPIRSSGPLGSVVNGDPITDATGWECRFTSSLSGGVTVRALCCYY